MSKIIITEQERTALNAFLYFLCLENAEDAKAHLSKFFKTPPFRLTVRDLPVIYNAITEDSGLAEEWSSALTREVEDNLRQIPVAPFVEDLVYAKVAIKRMKILRTLREGFAPLGLNTKSCYGLKLLELAPSLQVLAEDIDLGKKLLIVAHDILWKICASTVSVKNVEMFKDLYEWQCSYFYAELFVSLKDRDDCEQRVWNACDFAESLETFGTVKDVDGVAEVCAGTFRDGSLEKLAPSVRNVEEAKKARGEEIPSPLSPVASENE